MKKVTLVFVAVMTLLLPVLAVDLVNTNIVGADNLPGDNAFTFDSAGTHSAVGSSLTGGSALAITDPLLTGNAFGGRGLNVFYLFSAEEIHVNSSEFYGGAGASVSIGALQRNVEAQGGSGINNVNGELFFTNSSSYGGDGGTLSAGDGNYFVNVNGGDAIYTRGGFVTSDGIYAAGGAGGSAVAEATSGTSSANGGNGITIENSNVANSVLNSDAIGGTGGYFENGAGVATADGGHGLLFADSRSGSSLVISNSTMQGSAGGTAVGEATGTSANGGDGVNITGSSVSIFGGTFSGGAAGKANGVTGEDGYAARFTDVDLIIGGDASFTGRGVLVDSSGNDVEINSGSFSAVEFRGDAGIDINGGTFESDLLFSGAGVKTLSISNTVQTTGDVFFDDGTTDVNLWSDEHFENTVISGGATVDFNARQFTLQEDYSISLDADSSVNFNGNMVAESNSTIITAIEDDGATVKTAQVGGSILTFGDGTQWFITGDAENDLTTITLASATTLNSSLGTNNFTCDLAQWWRTIVDVQVNGGTDLDATFGDRAWADAVDAPDGSQYAVAMTNLDATVASGSSQYSILTGYDKAGGQQITADNWAQTPEIASALIGWNSLAADQVKERVRSNLRMKKFGSSTSYSPAGASGPGPDWYDNATQNTRGNGDTYDNAVDSVNNWLPGDEDTYGNTADSVNNWLPGDEDTYDNASDAVKNVVPEVAMGDVPETYQFWGRGYAASSKKDDDGMFAGYRYRTVGAIVGVDKRYDNMLMGLGGGYANTTLEGQSGNDGSANTGHVLGYFSANNENLFVDASLNYAFSGVDVEGDDAIGYEGEYNAQTIAFQIGGGYGIPVKDTILITPEVSLLSTFYMQDEYTETSSAGFADKEYDAYNQSSFLTSLGATFSMIHRFDYIEKELEVEPEFRVHWMHEFNAEEDGPEYNLVGGTDPVTVALQAREEDVIKVGGGIRFSAADNGNSEFGIDLDGAFGADYAGVAVAAKFLHRF